MSAQLDLKEFKEYCRLLAEASADIIRPLFLAPALEIELKSDASPVTLADRGAEQKIRELIHRRYPSHGIIGEEYGSENTQAEFVWVLDPIDGTISFTSGCPLFGTLIALLHQGTPILGVINQPILRQFCLGDCSETTLNGRRITVREASDLSQATLLTTDIHAITKYKQGGQFMKLSQQAKVTRTWGDCYGYLLLASGYADIMCDPVMKPWDLLPLIPIISGAGGIITSWEGGPAATSDSCLAAAPGLHSQVVALLNG